MYMYDTVQTKFKSYLPEKENEICVSSVLISFCVLSSNVVLDVF